VLLRAQGGTGPLLARAGSIDLLLETKEGGEWVVVDYKTDEAPPREGVPDSYRDQVVGYVEAVAAARPLAVRGEIWWLRSGRVDRVS
jgi:ATP-dependent exoDNAse (exonuclease V) beta subunit